MIKQINNQSDWNNFLLQHSLNTFLQSWQWGQVQRATGEDVQYLGIFENNIKIGTALVITVNARRGKHYLIPHGPILPSPKVGEGSGVRYEAPLTELTNYLRGTAKQDNVVALRIAPLLTTTPEHESLFTNLGFRPAPLHVHAELTWVLDINKTEDQLLAGMRKTTRHAIRKAEQAGVTTQVITNTDQALARFWPLYNQTGHRHGFVPWPKDMIAAQLKAFSTDDQIFTIIASHQNQDLAAAIIPQFGSTAFYYHGASIKTDTNIPAAQLLQWSAIKEAKQRGLTRYNFWGISPENKPDHPFAGITTFKKGFGGQAIDYLHAQDLPCSIGYWKLWITDTYRKYKRGF